MSRKTRVWVFSSTYRSFYLLHISNAFHITFKFSLNIWTNLLPPVWEIKVLPQCQQGIDCRARIFKLSLDSNSLFSDFSESLDSLKFFFIDGKLHFLHPIPANRVFHNSCLIRRTQQSKIYKHFRLDQGLNPSHLLKSQASQPLHYNVFCTCVRLKLDPIHTWVILSNSSNSTKIYSFCKN